MKKSRALHIADNGGERSYALLPHALLKSVAYRTSSFRARAVLLAVAERFNGFNNGHICVSRKQLADALNCWNYSANAQAIGELIARGIISLERVHPNGSRLSPEYRLTFISSGANGKVKPATNDYRAWSPGDAGSISKRSPKKSTRVAITQETPASGVAITQERKPSGVAITQEQPPNDRNPSDFQKPSCAVIAPHVVSHRVDRKYARRSEQETAGGVATIDLDALRAKATALIAGPSGVTQKTVAEAAKILPGTLSKFLRHGKGLPRTQFIALQLALAQLQPRAAA